MPKLSRTEQTNEKPGVFEGFSSETNSPGIEKIRKRAAACGNGNRSKKRWLFGGEQGGNVFPQIHLVNLRR